MNQNGGVFHLETGGGERERERSIKKAIDHRRENDPDTHLHCVVVERHLNVCIVLTGSGADALIS